VYPLAPFRSAQPGGRVNSAIIAQMSVVTVPSSPPTRRLRPLNVMRDLPAVADLLEICFHDSLDSGGRRTVRQMRRAGGDPRFLNWATRAAETISMPLTGYVWEQDGRIVGNVSLVPFPQGRQRLYLLANIAVHPDYRRRGLARLLTEQAVAHACRHRAAAIWLQVREDNPAAVALYSRLGFRERSRRTTWRAEGGYRAAEAHGTGITVSPRRRGHWAQQRLWLERLYPDELVWYDIVHWETFGPGLRHWLHLLFVEADLRQWAALKGNELLATLSWLPRAGQAHALWLAGPPEASAGAVTALLVQARRSLAPGRKLSLDLPAGEFKDALLAAGFSAERTQIWMQAEGPLRPAAA
jgi:GNAT superfamily N-acetyltransferase